MFRTLLELVIDVEPILIQSMVQSRNFLLYLQLKLEIMRAMVARLRNYANRNDVDRWKNDTLKSVEQYNRWFLDFAPEAYIRERKQAMDKVCNVFSQTDLFQVESGSFEALS